MSMVYYALSWYFDITYYEAIDIYDEMKSLGEDKQLENIYAAYVAWRHGADG